MANKIALMLLPDDAEPILRKNAYAAAKYGAFLDYITLKTYNAPNRPDAEARKRWQASFLSAKRIVEAFGIEYELTSEQETLTLHFPYVGRKRKLKNVAGMAFYTVTGGKPDYAHPQPSYRHEVHSAACIAAANRVVKAWRKTLEN